MLTPLLIFHSSTFLSYDCRTLEWYLDIHRWFYSTLSSSKVFAPREFSTNQAGWRFSTPLKSEQAPHRVSCIQLTSPRPDRILEDVRRSLGKMRFLCSVDILCTVEFSLHHDFTHRPRSEIMLYNDSFLKESRLHQLPCSALFTLHWAFWPSLGPHMPSQWLSVRLPVIRSPQRYVSGFITAYPGLGTEPP